ncbi:MAG: synthase related protein:Selenide water dikinase [Pseudomonadota bacterium]|jgi:selenide,water dikinase
MAVQGDTQQEPVKLTQTVQKGGCAAKLPAGELRAVLAGLEQKRPPELLVGHDTMDDACLWDLKDGRVLVQTLDFFTPIVDDPFDFGAIAAANSISDVYAMGGTPVTAMTILAFPGARLPLDLIRPLMDGALSVLNRAGVALAGGHTIDDETLKMGFSVSGFVNKDKTWTNAGAKAGDVLILTKPLGTGTITAALKKGEAKPDWVKGAIDSMVRINDLPKVLAEFAVHAATDITGFGFAGHAMQMACASGCSFLINPDSLPTLEGTADCLKAGFLTRAHTTNGSYTGSGVGWELDGEAAQRWPDVMRKLVVDPQTSGGLLLAIAPDHAEAALSAIRRAGFDRAVVVGEVVPAMGMTPGKYLVFRR